MHLEKLSLLNFKNYTEAKLSFHPKINCFVGNNGMGKTNLLDAIHYLSFCKSFFNPLDSQNIRHDQGFFMLQGNYILNGQPEEIYCGIKRSQKKQFKRNNNEYERLSEHIGLFPLVMISPSDSELITGGSEMRRKFMDSIISQYDKVYLERLIAYNQVLTQRNALLKRFAETRNFDSVSLEVWDDQLIMHGEGILAKRKDFIKDFIPLFQKNYEFISDSSEKVSLEYESTLNTRDFKTALLAAIEKDRVMQYTTAGTHRDDLEFKLNGQSLKKFASQGQQKSYLLALKLAQFEIIKGIKKISPLLLLDDVYDKLDEKRFRKLISLVGSETYGQVFITDTHAQRIENLFNESHTPYRIFIVENADIKIHSNA
ncbi:MAG: DNA replication/repair protein RecF [Bacteroidia bacterium]|nr:DNA replication/repair protein RecF [Bacteroidia bacterium]